MENEQPSYYAIIPANVRYADIPDKAKLLYGEITALCNKEGYCWANNTYFANLYKVHKNTISRLIGILVKNGFLDIEMTPQQKGVEVSRKLFIPILKNVEGGILKNVEDNNTSINIKNNNTINTSENKFSQEIVDVMELFAEINPSIQYGNKTQRKACEDMIKRFGYEDTIRMVKQVISVQGEQYAPIATTPYKMYHKLADFKIYFDKKKSVNKVLDLSL